MNASQVMPVSQIPLPAEVSPVSALPAEGLNPYREIWWRRTFRVFLRWFLIHICRVQVRGLENLPREGGVLLTPNHLSYTDCFLLGALSPRPVRFLGTVYFRQFWWGRLLYDAAKVIAVDPKKPTSCLRAGLKALEAGSVVAIFPEGNISTSGELMAFQPGMELLARKAGVPTVPVVLQYCPLDRQSFVFRHLRTRFPKLRDPQAAQLTLLSPIEPPMVTTELVRQRIATAASDAYAHMPALQSHLAAEAVKTLAAKPLEIQVVDYAQGRVAMRRGMILAAAFALADRWRTPLAGEERVGVVFTAGLGGMLTNLALTLLGKSVVNLNFTAGAATNAQCIEQAGLKTIISAGALKAKLPADFPWTERVIDLATEKQALSKLSIALHFARILAYPRNMLLARYGVPTQGGDREAAVLFSSGSTGKPKGVVLSHRNVLANIQQIKDVELLSPDQKLLCTLPTFHSFGFTVTLWYPLVTGLKCVCQPSPLEVKKIADAVEREQVTFMIATPTFLRPYLGRVAPEKLASLRYVVGGAEKTPEGFAEQWQTIFGSRYLEGYGMTECSPVVAVNLPATPSGLPDRVRAGSVGKLLAGMAARVVDAVSGEELPQGSTGMLELRGPNLFGHYLNDPERSRQAFHDGWYVTGDLARFDAEGYLFIEGRLSRFSKLGGEMVPHGAVEEAIVRSLGLEQAERPLVAVTGVRDPQKGESLVLLTATELTPEQVRETLQNAGLPNLWIPRQIQRVDAIPCLATGKLDLQGIRTLAERR